MSEGNTQNINISGGNIAGLQVGNHNTQSITQNIGQAIPTVEQVFKSIEESLPEDVAEDMEASVLKPLQTLAALPPEKQASEDVKEQAQPLYQRLVPYAPQIGNGLMAFGEAALSALASSNPIVAGLLAVCKVAKTMQPAAATPSAPPDSQIA